ncbi:MAG: lysophospholipase [Myxococcaceae bacterium]|nr:lysophospholipase [Myxococcaceae bacterium]MCI0672053.1 lysophospholipase [Myxococcaceae bacterium]
MPDVPSARPKKRPTGRSQSTLLFLVRAGFGVLQRLAPPVAVGLVRSLWLTPGKLALKESEASALERGRGFQVPFDEGALWAWSWGRGPTVLLAHGWAGCAGQMTPLADALVAAGFRAVALDMPAHGASGGKRTHGVQMARALLALAEVTGPVHSLVAHSFGAVAATLALERGLRAERVVYIGAPSGFGAFAERFCRTLGLTPALFARFRVELEASIGVPWHDAEPRSLAPRMTAPLLVVHDREDREVELAEGEALARAWPGARLEVTQGLGHNRILREPTVHARVVAFLKAGAPEAELPAWAQRPAFAPVAELRR